MISAFECSKIKIGVCEDSLTSCIFDTLFLLSPTLLWEILHDAIIATPENPPGHKPIAGIGQLTHYEFWPHWNSSGTGNVNYVEPDVFIRFSECDVIIEAKRYETGQQKYSQWENEMIAYLNEYGKDKKQSYLIALGGLCNTNQTQIEDIPGIPIFQCRWSSILDVVCKILDRVHTNSIYYHSKINKAAKHLENEHTDDLVCSIRIEHTDNLICSILKLVLRYFEIHGYVQIKWLEELTAGDKPYKSYIKSSSQSISFLLNHNDFKNYLSFPEFSTLTPVLKNYNQSINIVKTTWEEWK